MDTMGRHTSLPCPSPTPEAYLNSCPLSQWCHPTISTSIIPFSSCLQSSPASGSFPRSQFFPSGGQSFGISFSASILPRNIQGWVPLGLTGLISLQSKRLSRVFSTTIQKHQFYLFVHLIVHIPSFMPRVKVCFSCIYQPNITLSQWGPRCCNHD